MLEEPARDKGPTTFFRALLSHLAPSSSPYDFMREVCARALGEGSVFTPG